MHEFQVMFATKVTGPKSHPEKVAVQIGASNWKMTREAALEWLQVDGKTFYVMVGEEKQYLVAVDRDGQSYLRTSVDWAQPNHLLELPVFPPNYGKTE